MTDLTPHELPTFHGPGATGATGTGVPIGIEYIRQRKREGLLNLARGLFRQAGISEEVVAEMSDEELEEGFENYKANVVREAMGEEQDEKRKAALLETAEQLLDDLASGIGKDAAMGRFLAAQEQEESQDDE